MLNSETCEQAVVLGHPGHELRIFQTLARRRPVAYLLTDGSGGTGRSRAASTLRTLDGIGVPVASPFPPPLADARVYEALLTGRHTVLLDWAHALAEDFRRRRIRIVLADAAEGFNPAHDVCRAIAHAAALTVGATHYAYLLEGRPDTCPAGHEAGAQCVDGTPGEQEQKHAAMDAYPEIRFEVDRATAAWGREAFAREWIFRDEAPVDAPPEEVPPAYERFGEARVKSGKYGDVIRYEAHMRPFLAALRAEFDA